MIAKSIKSTVFIEIFSFQNVKDADFSSETTKSTKSVKSVILAKYADFMGFADFHMDFMDFADCHVDFMDFGLKLVKLTISFHSTVRIQRGNINLFLKIHGFC